MNSRLLDFVVCPTCGADLGSSASGGTGEPGMLECMNDHAFPVSDGVPRLLRGAAQSDDDARAIQDSFSREWEYFDYRRDRTWAASSDERRTAFLEQLDFRADQLQGSVVLDAGCGVGVLSSAIASLGCEVVAADIGHQVVGAHRHYSARGVDRAYFLQADLMRPPFRPAAFDVIYCGGVLHHTPDTKATFDRLMPALAPGGRAFVWLYHHVPGLAYDLRMGARRVIVRLPAAIRQRLVLALLPQALARQRIRIALGRQAPESRLNKHEKLITMLDSFTCRYRWEHTPDEVEGWYRELGFVDIKTTDVGTAGFGVVATKPAAARAREPARQALQRA